MSGVAGAGRAGGAGPGGGMVGGFAVDPAVLAAHAAALEAAERRLAGGAPGPAVPSTDAFGLVGRLFAGAAGEAAGAGLAALEAARRGLVAAAAAARQAGAAYREADLAAALALERAAGSGSP
ncbi:hypothetical protein LWC35_36610 [Pseudonocardia kujensis]|uniref:hypothetical protein n=1 Tax=Pseudonocardia kujensis TaxID=1128675 RepID=UPI001E3C5AB7|nr:hypothetical protein [Pseudonocardia kujensis]MCE0768374.1 hypothetical protein [Pseudonocardia kujensis]